MFLWALLRATFVSMRHKDHLRYCGQIVETKVLSIAHGSLLVPSIPSQHVNDGRDQFEIGIPMLIWQCAIVCIVGITPHSALEIHLEQIAFLGYPGALCKGGAHRVRSIMPDEVVCML